MTAVVRFQVLVKHINKVIMQEFISILFLISPIVFFVGLYYLFFTEKKNKNYKILVGIFGTNLLILIFLVIKSYKQPYISLYYGILGIVGFTYAARGVFKYFSNENRSKEQKINILIYIIICFIIGFGMCSTTGIFGF